MEASDDQLWQVCRKLPSDYEPYGQCNRKDQADCSGCRWFQPLLRYGVLAWGTCANPDSPRAGLLTFREQGCESFEQAEEPTDNGTWRDRAEFKDKVENILIEAHGQFIHIEIGNLNDPTAHDIFWLDHFESSIERALNLLLLRLLKREATFDRLQAAKEVIAELKQESDGWECGRRACERTLERRLGGQAAEASAVRMPDDIRSLDNEFWQRVEDAIREGLEGGETND
jgi:hypothetical protein